MYGKSIVRLVTVSFAILLLSVAPIAGSAVFITEPVYAEDIVLSVAGYDLAGVGLSNESTIILLPLPPLVDYSLGTDPTVETNALAVLLVDVDGSYETGKMFIMDANPFLDVTFPVNATPAVPGVDVVVYLVTFQEGSTFMYNANITVYGLDGTPLANVVYNGTASYNDRIGGIVVPLGLGDIAAIYKDATGNDPGSPMRVYLPGSPDPMTALLSYYMRDTMPGPAGPVTLEQVSVIVDGDPADWPSTALVAIDYDTTKPLEGSLVPGNVTGLYLGVDTDWLYVGVPLDDPLIDTASVGDASTILVELTLSLDYDNDGVSDATLVVSNSRGYVRNGTIGLELAEGTGYQAHLFGSFLEAAFNLSIIAPGLAPGDNITVVWAQLTVQAVDDLDSALALDYLLGKGGWTLDTIPLAFYLGAGTTTISVYNSQVTLSTSRPVMVVVDQPARATVNTEPPQLEEPLAFLYLWVNDTASIQWPINITVTIDPGAAQGKALGMTQAYLYNKTAGAFTPLETFTLDIDTLKAIITLSSTDYAAGDPLIMVAAPPAGVGGDIVASGYPLSLLALAVVLLAVLAGILARRHA